MTTPEPVTVEIGTADCLALYRVAIASKDPAALRGAAVMARALAIDAERAAAAIEQPAALPFTPAKPRGRPPGSRTRKPKQTSIPAPADAPMPSPSDPGLAP